MSSSAEHTVTTGSEPLSEVSGAASLQPSAAAPARPTVPHGVAIAILIALVIGWFSLIQYFGEGDVYAVIGPYACLVSLISVGLYPRGIATWLRPTPRAFTIGLGVGIGMVALTYPVFQVANALMPELDGQVQRLYSGARSTTLPKAFAWVLAIAFAEEILFRGVFFQTLRRWLSERAAYATALVVYAVAQGGTGSWIVMAMAFVCGTVWSIQRMYTGSLLSPLVAHLIWTPTVILFYPVT